MTGDSLADLRIRVVPGPGVVAVLGEVLLVVPSIEAGQEDALGALLAAAGSSSLERGVARVVADFDDERVPGFCLVAPGEAGGLFALVHGEIELAAEGIDGGARLRGREARTWVDRFLPTGLQHLCVTGSAAPEAVPDPYADLRAGVVRGGGVLITARESAGSPQATATGHSSSTSGGQGDTPSSDTPINGDAPASVISTGLAASSGSVVSSGPPASSGPVVPGVADRQTPVVNGNASFVVSAPAPVSPPAARTPEPAPVSEAASHAEPAHAEPTRTEIAPSAEAAPESQPVGREPESEAVRPVAAPGLIATDVTGLLTTGAGAALSPFAVDGAGSSKGRDGAGSPMGRDGAGPSPERGAERSSGSSSWGWAAESGRNGHAVEFTEREDDRAEPEFTDEVPAARGVEPATLPQRPAPAVEAAPDVIDLRPADEPVPAFVRRRPGALFGAGDAPFVERTQIVPPPPREGLPPPPPGFDPFGVPAPAAPASVGSASVGSAARHRGRLVIENGPDVLVDRECVIGRNPEADPDVVAGRARAVTLPDLEQRISRVHARLTVTDAGAQIMDVGSVNGTWIEPPGAEGWIAVRPGVPAALPQGSRIQVGDLVLSYEAVTAD